MLKTNKKLLTLKKEESISVITEMEEILASLANQDAIKIFQAAYEGITSSTKIIEDLNLTQKRYYTRLRQLIEAGLIEKIGDAYKHTLFGKLCHSLGEKLLEAVTHRDRLDLMDRLNKAKTISEKETQEIAQAISKSKGLDILQNVSMITDYDSFISAVINLLENTKTSAYVAANKTDLRVKDAVFNIIDRELELFFLSCEGEGGFSESIETLKMVLNPSSIKVVRKLLKSKELNIRITENLAFSFLIIDGEYGLIELPHPTSKEFNVAFEFKNAVFCKKLKEMFMSLYEEGEEDPRIRFAKKYLTLFKKS